MAPVTRASSQPVKAIPRPIVPAIPHIYTRRPAAKQASAPPKPSPLAETKVNGQVAEKTEEKLVGHPEAHPANRSRDVNRDRESSVDENGQTFSVQPSPVQSAPTLGSCVPVADSSSSVDGKTVFVTADPYVDASPEASQNDNATAPGSSSTPNAQTFVVAADPYIDASPEASQHASNVPDANTPALPNLGYEHRTWQPTRTFRPPFHSAHPSNGSAIFGGGLQGSNSSSPAPHPNGGLPPPNGMVFPGPATNGYAHQVLPSPVVDFLPPAMGSHYGPMTPHSFHGSQSSGFAEDSNGGLHPGGHLAHNRHSVWTPLNGNGPMRANGSMAGPQAMDQFVYHYDQTLAYVRSGVDDDNFTDCVLELHFQGTHSYQGDPDYQHLQHVVRMRGHRFVLARSPVLRDAMRGRTGPGGVLCLELQSEFLRSDVVSAALRTLYGWSMDDAFRSTDFRPRGHRDDLKRTLSYVAAGQYFQLPWVFGYAMHRANCMVDWETMGLVADFALPTVVVPRYCASKFSLASLVNHVVGFIIRFFPRDFVLDVKAGYTGFSRLPYQDAGLPASLEGSSESQFAAQSYMPQGLQPRSHNPGLKEIRFGDLSVVEQNGHASTGHSGAPVQQATPSPISTLLSGILLNLPYELLKQVMEAPTLGSAGMEMSPPSRRSIIADIIAEREARRMRALNVSRSDRRGFHEALDKAETPLAVNNLDDFLVNSLGFKEEMCDGDMPFLVHTWTRIPTSSEATS